MSELASVEKLRGYMLYDSGDGLSAIIDSDEIADEIEREVAERYMLLPVDADGVPIHLGDRLWVVNGYPFYVHSIVVEKDEAFVKTNTNSVNFVTYKTDKCHHVELHTIEDVLRECCNEWNEHCGDDWESGVYAKYAAVLRGMMEAD